MSTIVTRAGKGASLTWAEGDANITNLNTDKYQAGDSPTFVTAAITTANVTTANITTAAVVTANVTTANITTANVTNLDVATLATLTGGQLRFPVVQVPSANAYTLDDYREVSYTPTVTAETGTITSYTIDSGQVTRIGRVVTASCILTITNAGTGADALLVTAPYTAGHGAVGAGKETAVTNAMLSALLLSAGTLIIIEEYDGTTCIQTGATIHFSITYMV